MNDDAIMNGLVVVNDVASERNGAEESAVMAETTANPDEPRPPVVQRTDEPPPASKPPLPGAVTRKGGRPGTWNRLS